MARLDAEGQFKCRVQGTDQWIGESVEKGTPHIAIPLEVIEGSHAGKQITGYLYLTETVGRDGKMTCDRSIETLATVFGFDGDLEALYQGKTSFAGMECWAETECENFNGEDRVRVKWLRHIDHPSRVRALDEAKADKLIGRLNQRGKAVAKKAQENTSSSACQSPQNQDDLPF